MKLTTFPRDPGFTVITASARLGVIAHFPTADRAAEYQRAIAEFMRAIEEPAGDRPCDSEEPSA